MINAHPPKGRLYSLTNSGNECHVISLFIDTVKVDGFKLVTSIEEAGLRLSKHGRDREIKHQQAMSEHAEMCKHYTNEIKYRNEDSEQMTIDVHQLESRVHDKDDVALHAIILEIKQKKHIVKNHQRIILQLSAKLNTLFDNITTKIHYATEITSTVVPAGQILQVDYLLSPLYWVPVDHTWIILLSTIKRMKRFEELPMSRSSAVHTTASGAGLSVCIPNKEATLVITTNNTMNQRRYSGGDVFVVRSPQVTLHSAVVDLKTGQYSVTYHVSQTKECTFPLSVSLTKECTFPLSVLLYGRPIHGSPFSVNIIPGFITVWRVDSSCGSSCTVTLPLENDGVYDFKVNWGDGNTSFVVESNQGTHQYASAGTYHIRIIGQIEGFNFNNSSDGKKLLEIRQWGDLKLGNNGGYFANCSNLVKVSEYDAPDLSATTNMNGMFYGATVFNSDLSSWDVSAVTDMNSMFCDAAAFNGNLSGWDISSVKNMGSMFRGAASFNSSLRDWDISYVDVVKDMFVGSAAFKGRVGG